jgi:Predicted metal-dependent hydrolase
MKVKVLSDSQLGDIFFRFNPRAKRYIIRIKQSTVSVTIPLGGNYKFAEKFFLENQSTILQKVKEKEKEDLPKQAITQQQEAELRYKAKQFLPGELERLAKEHGFVYKEIKIRKSKTRWGSCSSKLTISLSIYLMLLPQHLIEYILLHELCHTVHMNHGTAFWELLDKHTSGKSKELKKEIRNFPISK